MKKILLVGRSGCGKTTLLQRMNGLKIEYRKTQTITYENNAFDTPGEYLENRNRYSALIVSSYDCDVIGMVQAMMMREINFHQVSLQHLTSQLLE